MESVVETSCRKWFSSGGRNFRLIFLDVTIEVKHKQKKDGGQWRRWGLVPVGGGMKGRRWVHTGCGWAAAGLAARYSHYREQREPVTILWEYV